MSGRAQASPSPTEDQEYAAAVAGWVVHLRSGGTTPWSEWLQDVGRPTVAPDGSALPGAPQLELLRRLNVLGFEPARVDQVLHRPAPGRGAVDLTLPWPPAELGSDRELLRVACGVLADLTASLPDPPRPRRPWLRSVRATTRPAPVGPAVALGGAPYTVKGLRTELPGWRDPELAVLVVAPLDEALQQVWSRRAERGSVGAWRRFLSRVGRDGRLPSALDVGAAARRWSERVGADNVHVVPLAEAPELLEQLVGVRPEDPTVRPLAPSHVELLRRVGKILPFVVDGHEIAVRRGRLAALLREDAEAEPAPGPSRLAVPEDSREWWAGVAPRVVREVEATGCQVHGDLAATLVPEQRLDQQPLRVPREAIAAAAVRMIHRVGGVVDDAGAGRRG